MLAEKINYSEEQAPLTTVVIGYDASKHNALKHGILSQYTVMQWEKKEDYDALLASLVNEYTPQSVTEAHLVEELAGIMWRKMRLRYAEMTSIQSSLSKNIERDSSYDGNYSAKDALFAKSYEVKDFDARQAVICSEAETQDELAEARKYLNCCLVAEQILLESNLYDEGLAALHEDDRDNWLNEWLGDSSADIEGEHEENEEDDNYTATAESLLVYIDKSKKHYEKSIYELENRSKVKQQILGKSFLPDKELDKYTRYENHLDKKFEKALAMLLKIKDLRENKQP